ncbi:MAG: response regulator transcription factor [Gammaproteobacteria bacterium]
MSVPAARLLLVDDDMTFCAVLGKALERRGYAVTIAYDAGSAWRQAQRLTPDCAVLDLNMPGASGLTLVPQLKRLHDGMQIVVLTGYASIATAVEAIKLGATYYLAKPADADQISAALQRDAGDSSAPLAARPLSVGRLEWEHIQRVLMDCDGNISAAARSLNMHRRTLQRKLHKRPPHS